MRIKKHYLSLRTLAISSLLLIIGSLIAITSNTFATVIDGVSTNIDQSGQLKSIMDVGTKIDGAHFRTVYKRPSNIIIHSPADEFVIQDSGKGKDWHGFDWSGVMSFIYSRFRSGKHVYAQDTYILYKDALSYKGVSYDLKMNIYQSIGAPGAFAYRATKDGPSGYSFKKGDYFSPGIDGSTKGTKVGEWSLGYQILDQSGRPVSLPGLYAGLGDIDGVYNGVRSSMKIEGWRLNKILYYTTLLLAIS